MHLDDILKFIKNTKDEGSWDTGLIVDVEGDCALQLSTIACGSQVGGSNDHPHQVLPDQQRGLCVE
jgi:hypothetical protein